MTLTDNGIARGIARVPLFAWIFLVTQTVAIIVYAVRLEGRVVTLESHQLVQNTKHDSIERSIALGGQALVRMEERDRNMLEKITRLEADLSALQKDYRSLNPR